MARSPQHDKYLGIFVAKMKELGVWDDTIFVITSDHGEEFDDHGSWGHGHSIYQELLHVPLTMRLPGVIPNDVRVPEVVSTMDISATVLDFSGVEPMATNEGQSLVGYATGTLPSRPSLAFSDFQNDRRVITAGQWKFILRGNLTSTLFDLGKDPREEKRQDSGRPSGGAALSADYGKVSFWGPAIALIGFRPSRAKRKELKKESADMDEQIKAQLKALGYAH